ncbi:IS1595 family transposase [Sphingopyxis sp. OPL5]|uniref:IS1595 family transposase n=1 Tax=Sphingopyxis sp. OPL5 TaxID=2486273 RepID=UPI00164E9ADB|nr:IS1595 family transposase [Sphingopyxis sp. OPL5]QNO26373.1 IS1595 family transposase [Sphingopyxis sp. OPL5]
MTNITAPHFHDETKAREHLEAIRWPEGPTCPHCGSFNATRLEGKKHRAGLVQCNDCREQFTVTVGTVFERSKVPLHKWLLCNHLLCASKKGMSAKQIERMLGVTYKTAWFMCHRIREAMKTDGTDGPLGGPDAVVEADETYVGGKAKNRATRSPAPKKAVVALVERDGQVRSFHVANVNAKHLRGLIVTNVDRRSHLMTDESMVYTSVGREFNGHSVVNHSAKEYVTTGGFKHSNTAENFFSIFKRGVIGTYHHMSEAHLARYTGEFDFRYNTRTMTDAERASIALSRIGGKRLTYRRTDAIAA